MSTSMRWLLTVPIVAISLWLVARRGSDAEPRRANPAPAARRTAPPPVRQVPKPVATPDAAPPLTAPRRAGQLLAAFGVITIEDRSDGSVRTIRLLDDRGQVVATIIGPAERDPHVRTLEVSLEGRVLGVEVVAAVSSIDGPTLRLLFDEGRIELAGRREPAGPTLPQAYAAHIRLLDAFQREANGPLTGGAPIELVRDRTCGALSVLGEGVCFGDCPDLACTRAGASLNLRCTTSGGCCRLERCFSECRRVATETGEITALCVASQRARLVAP